MISIIDYGMGNIRAIENIFRRMNIDVCISQTVSDIEKANKLILPGVGAFDNGMRNLIERDLIDVLAKRVLMDKIPILGICLGMQLMTKWSEEGILPGLGWLEAKTIRFRFGETQKINLPHMGWNTVKILKKNDLYKNPEGKARFYFAHSYHIVCDKAEDIVTMTTYGYEFISAVQKENIFGVQFHPEKSHKFGMELLKNFYLSNSFYSKRSN